MEAKYTQEHQYLKAKKQVKVIKGFYIHFFLFCLTMPIIIYVNLTFVPHFHWFWFSLLGWGISVFLHWMLVFGKNIFGFGNDWEEKKIKEIMQKEQQKESRIYKSH